MENSKIIPLGERVLVRPFKQEAEEKTSSGIIITKDDKEEKTEGTVIAISDSVDLNGLRMDIKVNSIVIFGKYAGDDYEKNGDKYKFLKVEDLLGVLK